MDDENYDAKGQQIWADRKLARIVFRNVLANSIKYRSRRRELKIAVDIIALSNSGYEIRINDNGSGFMLRDGESPFDAFVRFHDRHSTEGTGLGLNIVKTACDQLGWVPTITSVQDEGTTLTIAGVSSSG